MNYKNAAGASGASGALGLASQGTQIASQITTLISSLSNQKQQLQAQQAFQNLSLNQQNELNTKIAAASSHNEQLKILVDALVNTKNQDSTAKSQTWLVPVLIGVGLLAVVTVLVIVKKRG